MTVEKIPDNKEPNELKDQRQQIELLAMIIKSATVGKIKPNVVEGVSSLRQKCFNILLRKGLRGHLKRKRPLKSGQKPIRCYRCDGWGHGVMICPTLENLNWRELVGAVVSSTPGSPSSTPIPTANENP